MSELNKIYYSWEEKPRKKKKKLKSYLCQSNKSGKKSLIKSFLSVN